MQPCFVALYQGRAERGWLETHATRSCLVDKVFTQASGIQHGKRCRPCFNHFPMSIFHPVCRKSAFKSGGKKTHTRDPFPFLSTGRMMLLPFGAPLTLRPRYPSGKNRGLSGDARPLAIWRGSKALCAIVGQGQGVCETSGTWDLGGRTNISQSMDSLNAMCANRGPERSTRDVMRAGVKILHTGRWGVGGTD